MSAPSPIGSRASVGLVPAAAPIKTCTAAKRAKTSTEAHSSCAVVGSSPHSSTTARDKPAATRSQCALAATHSPATPPLWPAYPAPTLSRRSRIAALVAAAGPINARKIGKFADGDHQLSGVAGEDQRAVCEVRRRACEAGKDPGSMPNVLQLHCPGRRPIGATARSSSSTLQ